MTEIRSTHVLFYLVLLFTPGRAPGDSVHVLNEKGVEAMDAGEYEAARQYFKSAHLEGRDNKTVSRNYVQSLNALGVEKGRDREYRSAELNLKKAVELDPDNRVIRRNLMAVLLNHAVDLMEKKWFERADRKYSEAYRWSIADDSNRVDEARGKNFFRWGLDLQEKNDVRKAVDRFEDSLNVYPEHVGSLVKLGEIYYDKGNHIEALANLMLAREIKPDISGLTALMEKVEREGLVEQDFNKRSSRNFHLSYEGESQERSARIVMKILKQAYRQVGSEMKYYPTRKIPVVLYTDNQYQSATVAPHWAGALYDGKIRLPVNKERLNEDAKDLELTTRHEYTHALIHELAHYPIPAWMNEGLAGHLELERKARRQRHENESHELKQLLTDDDFPVISRLPEKFISIESSSDASLAYLISRHFVSWLIDKYQAFRITAALKKVDKDMNMLDAIRDTHGFSVDSLELQWWDDLNRR
jgi:tetratricopeptide (TPR) repeat protein